MAWRRSRRRWSVRSGAQDRSLDVVIAGFVPSSTMSSARSGFRAASCVFDTRGCEAGGDDRRSPGPSPANRSTVARSHRLRRVEAEHRGVTQLGHSDAVVLRLGAVRRVFDERNRCRRRSTAGPSCPRADRRGGRAMTAFVRGVIGQGRPSKSSRLSSGSTSANTGLAP